MYTIATLHDLRRQLNLSAADTADDADLLRRLEEASSLVESMTLRQFCPQLATRSISIDPAHPQELILPDDLLELHAIRDDGGTIELAKICRLPSDQDLPASVLQRADGAPFRFSDSPSDAVNVTGIWGWHDRWSVAWRDSGDTVGDNPLSATATVISVSDVAGLDQDGFRPRFHVGHLLRIAAEYLRVIAIDHQRHRLTVLRAVAGTTASAHPRGSRIELYAPAPLIRDLTLRYAELLSKTVGLLDGEMPPLLAGMRRFTA